MPEVTIHPYCPASVPAVADLQRRDARAWPGARIIPPEMCALSAFEQGANILCACDADGSLVGYAPIYPSPLMVEGGSFLLWTVPKADPEAGDRRDIQDALHRALLGRARVICARAPADGCRIVAQCQAGEVEAIGYLASRGRCHADTVFNRRRDLARPVDRARAPEGIELREWPMRTKRERRRYLRGRNRAMPESPHDEETLARLLETAVWPTGTTVTAFSGSKPLGNVMIYIDPAESERSGRGVAITEDIWVLPK